MVHTAKELLTFVNKPSVYPSNFYPNKSNKLPKAPTKHKILLQAIEFTNFYSESIFQTIT